MSLEAITHGPEYEIFLCMSLMFITIFTCRIRATQTLDDQRRLDLVETLDIVQSGVLQTL